ncbi:MAG: hypothetical protein D6743_16390 [Calditrichaeota bacterium]|nr:MAG: hypothetical protein D6743_16390 [Calditrichota bacterium]
MIQANCRTRFTADDFGFIVEALARDKRNKAALTELLTDEEVRDQVLDDEALLNRLLSEQGLSKISPYLYFYLLTRRAFLQNRIDDRELSDYVACMLAEFCSAKRAHTISPAHQKTYDYLVDLMIDSLASSSSEAFLLRSHLGNYALFVSGIFPDAVYRKATYGRRAPGFEYYEEMGRTSYRWAAQHRLAVKYNLVRVLDELARRFHQVRLALNTLADKYLVLHTKPDLDTFLRQIFFGKTGPESLET